MKSLLDQEITDRIVVRTKVSEEVFSRVLPPFPYYHHRHHSHRDRTMEHRKDEENEENEENEKEGKILRSEPPHELDASTVQSSPLDVDPISTLRDLVRTFHRDRLKPALLEETVFVSSPIPPSSLSSTAKTMVTAVLCDASPLELEFTHHSNVPGILVSSLDWCSIYELFFQQLTSRDEPHLLRDQTHRDDPSSSSFYSRCRSTLDTMASIYHKAMVVVRPRTVVASTVSHDRELMRMVDVPWICSKVLRKTSEGSPRVLMEEGGRDGGDSVLREKLKSLLFGGGRAG